MMARRLSKVLFFLALCSVIVVGYTAHIGKYLNLSGDEVHFVFQGLRQWTSGNEVYYASTLQKLESVDGAALNDPAASNLRLAKKYLPLQRLYYEEYALPKIVWAATTVIVDMRERQYERYDIARFVSESIYFMFLAGVAIASIMVILIATRLSRDGKVAVLAAFVVFAIRDTLPIGQDVEAWLSTSSAWAVLVKSFASSNKDLMVFGLSARSLFLLVLVAVCVLRWDQRNTGRAKEMVMLPVLSLIHATSGLMVVAIFITSDLVSMFHKRQVIPAWRLLGYALTIALCARSGSFSSGWLYAGVYLAPVLMGFAAHHQMRRRWAGREPVEPSTSQDVLLVAGACLSYVLGALMLESLQLGSAAEWSYQLIGERFGAIAAVVALSGLCYLGSRWVIATFPFRASDSRAGMAVLAVSALTLTTMAAAIIFVRPESVLSEARTRLYSHSKDFEIASAQEVTFDASNGLHLIWYGIIRSSLSGRDETVIFR